MQTTTQLHEKMRAALDLISEVHSALGSDAERPKADRTYSTADYERLHFTAGSLRDNAKSLCEWVHYMEGSR